MHRLFSAGTFLVLAAGAAALVAPRSLNAAVVESWDFENATSPAAAGGVPTDGFWFTDTQAPRSEASGSNGSLGVNGTLIRGFNEVFGPQFDSDVVNPNGGSFSMDTVDDSGDGYVTEGALHNWSASDWTLQMHVYFDDMGTWETLAGRDGSTVASPESDFYFQKMGDGSGQWRINYVASDDTRHILVGNTVMQAGQWYGLAVVADSTAGTLTLYVDNGSGYSQDGQLTGLTTDLGIKSSALGWTFARGWYNGGFGDHIDGRLDNIQFDDTALASGDLLSLGIPEPSSIMLGSLACVAAGLGGARRRRNG